MKNMFKKITVSVMAVASLTVGMVGMSANAASWGLYNNVSGPSESRKYSDPAGFYVSTSRSSITEQCTSYSSGQQSNGSVAYAKYNAYAVTNTGSVINNLTGVKYHYGTSAPQTIKLSSTVPANSTIYGNYTLMNYSSIGVSIYGTIS